MNYAYVITGFGLLLCGSFIDGSRAPLLPVLSHHFQVNYQQVSLFLVAGYFTSVVSTSLLIPICKRIGARQAGLFACLLTVSLSVVAQLVHSFPVALLFGVLIACCSSSLGAMANVFVLKGSDLAQRGRYMSGLHTMYGLGAQAGPLAVAWGLSHGYSWKSVFAFAAIPAALLGSTIFLRVPKDKPFLRTIENPAHAEPPFQWISVGGLVVLIAAFYVAAEVLTSNWMVTFLVETQGFTVEEAAPYLAGFFWSIALTRALCFVVHSARAEAALMWGSLVAALTFFSLGLSGYDYCFPLAGVLGPFFPLMLTRMSRYIPEQAESVSIRVMAGMQLTLAVCNLSAGTLVDRIGAAKTYFLPAFFMVGTIALATAFIRYRPKKTPKMG